MIIGTGTFFKCFKTRHLHKNKYLTPIYMCEYVNVSLDSTLSNKGAEMVARLSRLLEPISSLFFLPECYVCGGAAERRELLHNVCAECWNEVRQVGDLVCFRCGLPIESEAVEDVSKAYFCGACRGRRIPYSVMRSLYNYRTPMREMIHIFKFEGKTGIGGELGRRLAEWAARHPDLASSELVAPVPLHPLRRIERGFNQAELLARLVAREMGLPLVPALRRRRNTPPQSSLEPEQRRRSLKGAFAVPRRSVVRGKRVLLVDDMATTETTVRECARELRRAGAAEVKALTLARSLGA